MTPPSAEPLGVTVTIDPTIPAFYGAELLGLLRAALGRYVILSSSKVWDFFHPLYGAAH